MEDKTKLKTQERSDPGFNCPSCGTQILPNNICGPCPVCATTNLNLINRQEQGKRKKKRAHAIQRPLGREFKYREKIHNSGHPYRGKYSALTDLIPLALSEKGEMTATELINAIKELAGVEYKRNTISEICTILCLKNEINKIKKNGNGSGRPKTYWKSRDEAIAN